LWDRKKRKVSVIDFSDCILGDPAVDFAGLHEYGLDFVKRVLSLYGCEKDEHMLHRSLLYFKRIPLFLMNDALQGWHCTFEEGYKMFKKHFKLKIAMPKV